MSAGPPADSATVILLRESAGSECEVLLVQRHADSRAFAGAHVFPGGRVDAADAAATVQARSAGVSPESARARLAEGLAPAASLAFWVAAIRELFEETGILLADRDGVPVGLSDPTVGARFAVHRAALLAGTRTFEQMLAHERLALATDRVEYFSRWITPVTAPRRYDARFFVARLPEGQEPLHDARETTAADWFTPAGALASARAGTLTLTPPTVRTLEDLTALSHCEAIFAAARERRFPAILPKVVQVDGRMTILYPGDAAYERATPGAMS